MASSPGGRAVAVRFVKVSKRFAHAQDKNRSLTELPRRLVGLHPQREYFWPLRDVSFEAERGSTIGIVGKNGSGKSTVLKLISGIIEPTDGIVEVSGRVSALLELGAGFHPELSGRENIYLNGAVLGLRRSQMDRVFNQIVHFADMARFIDMPVKNYSSGMYARLGFAIAVNVDPDILLVDEVLTVGDENFQHRCLDAIRQFQSRRKTIIVVSHYLTQLSDLCDRGIWLHNSGVQFTGSIEDTIHHYLHALNEENARRLAEDNAGPLPEQSGAEVLGPPPRRWGHGPIIIDKVQMYNEQGELKWSFEPGEPVTVEISYQAREAVREPVFSLLIHKPDGHCLWGANTLDHPIPGIDAPGPGKLRIDIGGLVLTAGRYHLSAAAYTCPDTPYWSSPSDFHEWLYNFEVVSDREIHGDVVMRSAWTSEADQSPQALMNQLTRIATF